ncbi:carbohydrate kinase family protein [Mycoplasmopsis alligatoris]|uniref:Kinase, PfkB family n=1 Tax=Mycoplasmopsis alligatoris A21JP2 TaxID=747682 RepID=D4XVW5_9BACT|nr:hypothetical protein [Mycoplasmopsis alligatoris]EFF41514.1 kinase, PfkB family [Mycoplasmopsis alligatoris A21JP2]
MSNKILTIGETLLRINIEGYYSGNNTLRFFIGGDALNVAAFLGYNDYDVSYLTFLDKKHINYKRIEEHFNIHSIKTNYVFDFAGRMGLYYYLPKLAIKPARIEYDRSNTAFSQSKLSMPLIASIIKEEFEWIHTSATTMGANEKMRKHLIELYREAYDKKITTSLDVSYFEDLWLNYDEYKNTIDQILEHTKIIIGWFDKDGFKEQKAYISMEEFKKRIRHIVDKYENIKTIVCPLKYIKNGKTYLKTYSYINSVYQESDPIECLEAHFVGVQDAYVGMLINRIIKGKSLKDAVDYANKIYAIKNLYHGDCADIKEEEIEEVYFKKVT